MMRHSEANCPVIGTEGWSNPQPSPGARPLIMGRTGQQDSLTRVLPAADGLVCLQSNSIGPEIFQPEEVDHYFDGGGHGLAFWGVAFTDFV